MRTVHKDTAAWKREIADTMELRLPAPSLGRLLHGTATTRLLTGNETMATIEESGPLSVRPTQIRVAGRRLQLGAPEDANLQEQVGNFVRGFFTMPRRRATWRAGAGITAEIRETSPSSKQLAGHFTLDDATFQVTCSLQSGLLATDFDRRLHGPLGPCAELERSPRSRRHFLLTPYRPTRLDALVVAVHLMFWLERSVGASGGAPGGGGGGGGGC